MSFRILIDNLRYFEKKIENRYCLKITGSHQQCVLDSALDGPNRNTSNHETFNERRKQKKTSNL